LPICDRLTSRWRALEKEDYGVVALVSLDLDFAHSQSTGLA